MIQNSSTVVVSDELPDDIILECRGVGICYRKPNKLFLKNGKISKDFWAFRKLDLQLHKGETLGIVGRNGSGKSTLLRLLSGVTAPDEGVLIKRPNLSIQLLSVNLGFEKLLSGRENAIMAGMLVGQSAEHMLNRMDAILEFSGLGDFFDEPIYTYSSGMISRLGFSIAIEADPDILLLDEILSVGDAAFREKSKNKTMEIIKTGKSVVFVGHDMRAHEEMCNRIITL